MWHAVVVHSPNEPTCLLFWMLCSHSVAVNCPTIGYLYFVFLVVHRDLSVAFARLPEPWLLFWSQLCLFKLQLAVTPTRKVICGPFGSCEGPAVWVISNWKIFREDVNHHIGHIHTR